MKYINQIEAALPTYFQEEMPQAIERMSEKLEEAEGKVFNSFLAAEMWNDDAEEYYRQGVDSVYYLDIGKAFTRIYRSIIVIEK